MPIHNWSAIPAGIFHDFHQDWTIGLKHALYVPLPLEETYQTTFDAVPQRWRDRRSS